MMADDADRDHLPPEIEGGRIAGTVKDFEGYPLVGVRVEVAASEGADLDLLPTMTDGDGGFLLEGLAEGRYDLRFAVGGVAARTLAVPAGTADLQVRLARPQGILLVVKTPPGEGAPPDLLHVVLERETRSGHVREYHGRHLTSRMLLWSIRPGRYRMTVWGGTWLPVTASGIEVVEKEKAPLVEILLSARGATVEGRVRQASDAPLVDALVVWRRIDAPGAWPRNACTATTDEHGRFFVAGLPTGAYRVAAGPVTGPFAEHEIAISGEETAAVDLTLPG